MTQQKDGGAACAYCKGEPEPGWIEMPNNGPIVPCPSCNKDAGDEYAKAERQRDMQRRPPPLPRGLSKPDGR